MDRKLASVQTISSLSPIPNADRIVLAEVQGWNVIVRKDEFEVGDKCVYFEIDSILPDANREFHFITRKSENEDKWGDARLKTMKMRGVVSQGLALPLNILDVPSYTRVGTDVSKDLNISKYEKPEVAEGTGNVRSSKESSFPTHLVPKTDEPYIQSHTEILDDLRPGDTLIATQKLDGTSATYLVTRRKVGFWKFGWYKYDTYVCSRNRSVGRNDGTHKDLPAENVYWKINDDYAITKKLRTLLDDTGRTFAVQGEIVGPGIQKNPLKLDALKFYVHNIWDVDARAHLSPSDMNKTAYVLGLAPVEEETIVVIGEGDNGIPNAVFFADQAAAMPKYIEGLVYRLKEPRKSRATGQRLSFKVINVNYLLATDS